MSDTNEFSNPSTMPDRNDPEPAEPDVVDSDTVIDDKPDSAEGVDAPDSPVDYAIKVARGDHSTED